MKAEQIRARLAAIKESLDKLVATVGDGEYTDEQTAEVEKLNAEFDKLNKNLATAEKVEALQAKATAGTGRKTPAEQPGTQVEVIRDAKQRTGGFDSVGDFLQAVKAQGETGQVHKIFQSAAYERNGEDGGFLIPEELAEGIVTKLQSNESILAQTNQLKCNGNSLTINVDETQPWNQGVQAYWMAEGGPFTGTKAKFKQAQFRLQKLGALVVCTDELLDDAAALESYISNAAPAAIMHKINAAIINGDGVGKPQGLLQSPFTVTVAAEAGQAADSVVARNIFKMYSRMIPEARAGASWYMNAQVEEQLMALKDDLGNFIYLAPASQMNQTPYGILLGRPVIPMLSSMPQLGDSGDIVFANPNYYYTLQKSGGGGIKSASSIHLYFDTEKTAYRFSMRIDGKVPFTSPVTTEFGNYQVSAFTKLADRP